ncbi:hypothetical protein JCM30760_17250 [Thiomicrorhabdus hydrogeniphila]
MRSDDLQPLNATEDDVENFDDSDLKHFEAEHIELESIQMQCPYCWELFEWVIDDSDESNEMIEDCPVCCRPIHFKKQGDSGFNEPSHWEALSEEDFYE